MDIKFGLEKCEDSGAVFTVDHSGSELEISNASCLEKTQVDWLGKHKDEVINFLWKKQALLVETKKVFHDLDLPWTDEDFKSLSTPELECELEKALPLLQDEDLLKEVEETRQARLAGSDDGSSKGMIYGLADTIDTPLDELEGLVPAEFKARLEGLEVSPATVRNCLRLYLDGQEAMASKYLHNRVRGNST
jgi:hypothetical protein